MRLRAQAPAKVNLSLFVGPLRGDGRHELVTLFESVSLADELELRTRVALDDVVRCPGVEGPNLASRALERLRARGWDGPRVRIEIRKRIPIAAGMAGGSADAAAVLRMARRLSPVPDEVLDELAAELGADVPSRLSGGLTLGTGAGEVVEPQAPLAPHALLILPQPHQLSAAEVYREFDRLGGQRAVLDLGRALEKLRSALVPGGRLSPGLMRNDLQTAAVSLCPEIGRALEAAREAGADHVLVCGSGPTVAGVYWGDDAAEVAATAAATLAERFAGTTSAVPVSPDFGFPLFA